MQSHYALPGVGTKNKAEALYLLRGHEPRHRKFGGRDPNAGLAVREHVDDQNIHEAVIEAAVKNGKGAAWALQWQELMGKVAERFPSEGGRNKEMEERFGLRGSKVTNAEVEAFLGPAPSNEDLPEWLREAIPVEDGGLAPKELQFPIISYVKTALQFIKLPPAYGLVYGLLHHHALSRDAEGHPITWVSVERLAEEAEYSYQWVMRTLRGLEREGLIKTEPALGRTSLYTLLGPPPDRIGLKFRPGQKISEYYVEP